MSEKITRENILQKLKLHPREQPPAVCLVAGQLIEKLEAEINAAWKMIDNSFDIESRSQLESEAKTNGFVYGLAQAAHHIWKRDPKVSELEAENKQLRVLLTELSSAAKAYGDASYWDDEEELENTAGPRLIAAIEAADKFAKGAER